MGAGNPTISGEIETQVWAACQPRQPHSLKWNFKQKLAKVYLEIN